MLLRDIRTFLEGDADIRDAADGGIWPNKSREGTTGDRIILRMVSTNRNYSLDNEVSPAEMTIQIDCYGSTVAAAHDLFQLVRNRLSGYRGAAGDGQIEGAVIVNEFELEDAPEDASDKWIHRYTADFRLHYNQTVPTHA